MNALRISCVSALIFGAAVVLAGCSATGSDSATTTPAPTVTVTESPSPSASPSAAGPQQCSTANLGGSIAPASGGGAAGSTFVNIVLTNKGSSACTLQGWPGVSFVGDGNGTQLGAAAVFNRQSPHATVTLAADGGTATAQLQIVVAQNYSASDCHPVTADGFRVYPPGEKASLYIPDSQVTACTSPSIKLLTVNALVAG